MTTKTQSELINLYRDLHEGRSGFLVEGKEYKATNHLFDGSNFVTKLLKDFASIIGNRGDESVRVLDWGSGKAEHLWKPIIDGKTFHQLFMGRIQTYYCYDPGYERFSMPPSEHQLFDVVICADVMEHVPSQLVSATIAQIFDQLEDSSLSVALFTVSGKLAKKQFLDGENLHVTVEPAQWWVDHMNQHCLGRAWMMLYEDESGNKMFCNKEYQALIKKRKE